MKFSKQFEAQVISEWREGYVDYISLKRDLKKLQSPDTNDLPPNNEHNSLQNTLFCCSLKNFDLFGRKQKDHGAIRVHKRLVSTPSEGDMAYKTELLEQFADNEAAEEFFERLDSQLMEVNDFYTKREKYFLDKGYLLKKQLVLLQSKGALAKETKGDASISCNEDESVKDRTSQQEQLRDNTEKNDVPVDYSPSSDGLEKSTKTKKDDGILRIGIPLKTLSRTSKSINLLRGDMINQSSKKARKDLREAFMGLHQGLSYLDSYRNLNMLAFAKILKKFDRVTGKQVLPIYLREVETSYFNMSDKAIKLAEEVEKLFTKHFAGNDRRTAMQFLKPNQRKETHVLTFFIGLFTGCFIVLLMSYIIMAHITGTYKRQPDTVYMETVYPALSMFGLLFLHLFLYGCNIYAWRKTRINYSFILELDRTKELRYRDVFLICSISMSAVMGVMFLHLLLLAKGYSFQAIPGLLLLIFLLILLCPINIIYRSSRYRFLSVMRNIIFSPLYEVAMLDFFMADQLCSQVPMLRNLEYVACYYITGSYKTQNYGYCMKAKPHRDFAYAMSFLPYYWRAMQCARKWLDNGEMKDLANLGKYVSAMLAAGAKVAYENNNSSVGWLWAVVVMSSVATVYQLYWDFVKDWGLLQMNLENPWLREKLVLRRKSIYYFSMGLNLLLRLAWIQTVLHSNFEHVDYRVTGLLLAALEVIRRGHWNFYRVENEHLNNVGKYRAVKIVPLPFYDDLDDDDD